MEKNSPLVHGVVKDWDEMEKIWRHALVKELGISSEEKQSEIPVLLTENSADFRKQREKTAEIMFEGLNVPAIDFEIQGLMALLAEGRGSGVVLSCGDGITDVIPVIDYRVLYHNCVDSHICGRTITENLTGRFLYGEHRYRYYTYDKCPFLNEEMRIVKEKMGFVAYYPLLDRTPPQEYELPDGTTITLADERFLSTEALFHPKLVGLDDELGVVDAVFKAIAKCRDEEQEILYETIVLAGGSTMFPGFVDRVDSEIYSHAKADFFRYSVPHIRVTNSPNRNYLAWIGASILASLNTFPDALIGKPAYEEAGGAVVHRGRY